MKIQTGKNIAWVVPMKQSTADEHDTVAETNWFDYSENIKNQSTKSKSSQCSRNRKSL